MLVPGGVLSLLDVDGPQSVMESRLLAPGLGVAAEFGEEVAAHGREQMIVLERGL